MDNVVSQLEARGLLEALTSEGLREAVRSPCTVYAGFDPSSDSLQVGNLVAILGLRHFQRCGHPVIALAGGATGRIGDPSGKASERDLLDAGTLERNLAGIRADLGRLLDLEDRRAPVTLLDNNDWMETFTFVRFLRDVGKHFRMGSMLGKESVRTRIESAEGMSFAEFSYQILQAYDFLHLHDRHGCTVQLGGSDQWGNITAGVDLVRRLRSREVFGLTLPLVCDSAGRKFGKSEGNAIYLSPKRTPIFDFYQFFIRTEDADAPRLLRTFTFLPLAELDALLAESARAPELRLAQRRLAEETTRMVHGAAGLRVAQAASEVLFGGAMDRLSAADLLAIFAHVPSAEVPRDAATGVPVVDLAVKAGLCQSKGEARRLTASGGLYLNNRRVETPDATVRAEDVLDGALLVLRSGKRNFHLVRLV